jgi:KDO2-lipid IV(A) lauroyltransferase
VVASDNPVFCRQIKQAVESVWPSAAWFGDNASATNHSKDATLVNGIAKLRKKLRSIGKLGVDFAAYLLVRLIVAVIQTLPLDMGDSLCRWIGWLASGPLRVRRVATENNLRQIFQDADPRDRKRLSRAMWHHLLLMVCEIAWAQRRLHRTNWSRHARFRDNRKMLSYMLSNRPTVMVTGHFGNFEIGGYVIGLMGLSTLTIARRLDNPFLHRWVERFRGAKGQRMVDKEGCAAEVEQHLSSGGILALLADQHAGPKGCWVDFMGVPASCHKALALFALSCDAPMLVASTRRVGFEPMRFELACYGVADPRQRDASMCESVASLTQWYNERLAEAVDQAVEQYWWLHRRWREPPAKVSKRLAKNRPVKLAA